ncbi:RE1-silencing transcription factor isoform X2 [Eurytemora carolleeae]|nr:RE1-silencing transcription factor isoform X2 [Eurytemora carolleeae]|eukprot:XP_023324376.1 RE1-silencing transcription factor-like isoform X2 [Eurytemora affinis]
MVDLLKLQFSLEDNLLLMKQLNCFPTENEKKDVIVNAGRLQIALVSSVNQLGFQWMRRCPLFTSLETVSGEQPSSRSDINPVLDQTLSCLEIKIDFDEMDNLIDAGEEKILPLYSKFTSNDSKNLPGSKDRNEISSGTLENLSNHSSCTVTTVKEEELDSKDLNFLEFCEKRRLGKRGKRKFAEINQNSIQDCRGKEQNTNKNKFSCNFCNRSCKGRQSLKRHMKEVHEKCKFSCQLCPFVGIGAIQIRRHYRTVHPDNYQEFLNSVKSESLMRLQLQGKVPEIFEFPCTQCDFVAKTEFRLTKHGKKFHFVDEPCEHCDFVESRKEN